MIILAGLIPSLPENIEILIIVMALIYTAISIAAQRLLANTKRMREIQAKVLVMQKEMNEMLKSNATQEQLMAKQREFMPLVGEQMKNSMKPMFVILPLLLITYYLVIPNLGLGSNLSASKELFFILVFGIGMVCAIAILVYDRIMIKKEMAVQETVASANKAQQNNQ